MDRIIKYWSEILVSGVLLFLFFFSYNPGEELYRSKVVRSDGKGYFAYLPAVVAHQDLTWEASTKDESTLPESRNQHYLHKNQDGVLFDKYYPGVAILQVPFYALGYLLESTFNSGNSYGLLPILFFHIGSLFYGILGFILLKAFLKRIFERKNFISFVSVILFFGSNLFYQPVFHPSFSHHYSFAMMCLFALITRVYLDKSTLKNALLLGVSLGLVFLVRPTNGLIVFAIPFFLMSWQNTQNFLRSIFTIKNLHLFSAIIGFSICLLLLFILNYLQTGFVFNWSYQGEGFNFANPQIWKTLFSFRTGLFIHIPMLLISLLGFYFAYKKEGGFIVLSWLFYFALLVYLTASWWCWDYGGSWGHRVFTEQMLIFAPPMVLLFQNIKKVRFAQFIFIGFTVLFCFKLYQIRHSLSPRRLTPSMYFQTLLNFNKPEGITEYHFVRNCEPFGSLIRKDDLTLKESKNVKFNNQKIFGCDSKFVYPKDRDVHRFFIRINTTKKLSPESNWSEVFFVFDGVNEEGKSINYHAMPLYEFYKEGINDSKVLELSREMTDVQQELSEIRMYIWNKEGRSFELENIQVSVEEYGVIN